MLTSKVKKLVVFAVHLLLLVGCGGSGSDDSSPSSNVSNQNRPSVELSSSLLSTVSNGAITLEWSTSNVNSCVASGDWSGSKTLNGIEAIDNLMSDSTFSLTCIGVDGTISDTVLVSVASSTSSSISLSANPGAVLPNGTTSLSWNSEEVSNCQASGDWSGPKATSGNEVFNNVTSNSLFTLTCDGVGGSVTDSINVSVLSPPDPPVVNFTASASNVSYNGAVALNWSSSNASSCSASGSWSGTKAISDSQVISGLIADSTFTISCSGVGGNVSQSVNVAVASPPTVPVVNINASALNVAYEGSTTLSWNGSNVSSCTASGDWSGLKSVGGSETIDNLTANSSFTVSCTGSGGSVSDTVNVLVSPPPAPTISFSAAPASVSQNGTTTLSWNSNNSSGCVASGDWIGTKNTSGSEVIGSLTADSQFILTCDGAGGSVNSTVNVSVVLNNSGTALLSWTPPTENTDGSALTDLAGYKVYYGTNPGSYGTPVTINNPGLTSYLVENLAAASWYFTVTSFNSMGIESGFSTEVSKTIN